MSAEILPDRVAVVGGSCKPMIMELSSHSQVLIFRQMAAI